MKTDTDLFYHLDSWEAPYPTRMESLVRILAGVFLLILVWSTAMLIVI